MLLFGTGWFGADGLITVLFTDGYGTSVARAAIGLSAAPLAWAMTSLIGARRSRRGRVALAAGRSRDARVHSRTRVGLAAWTLAGVGIGLAYPGLYVALHHRRPPGDGRDRGDHGRVVRQRCSAWRPAAASSRLTWPAYHRLPHLRRPPGRGPPRRGPRMTTRSRRPGPAGRRAAVTARPDVDVRWRRRWGRPRCGWRLPGRGPRALLLLGHGAGGSVDSPTWPAAAAALLAAGYAVARAHLALPGRRPQDPPRAAGPGRGLAGGRRVRPRSRPPAGRRRPLQRRPRRLPGPRTALGAAPSSRSPSRPARPAPRTRTGWPSWPPRPHRSWSCRAPGIRSAFRRTRPATVSVLPGATHTIRGAAARAAGTAVVDAGLEKVIP